MKRMTLLLYISFPFVFFIVLYNANISSAQTCNSNSDCSITGECITEYKGKTINQCVKCKNDSHCTGALSKCLTRGYPIYNKCVECLQGLDCGSGKQCVDNTCYVCTTDSHCSGKNNKCLRNRKVQEGRCVECTTNSDCTLNQMCDTSMYTCKAKIQKPEPQISPEKYKTDIYKGRSPRQLETSPEIQQRRIEQKRIEPENGVQQFKPENEVQRIEPENGVPKFEPNNEVE